MRRQAIEKAGILIALGASLAVGQSSDPGHASYIEDAGASFDTYTEAPSPPQQQWLQSHFAAMVVYSPYFDSRLSWFPNGYAYADLYAIPKGSWVQTAHPEWILHDASGNWLYVPFGCGGGTCVHYAGDIANPAFRAAWINQAVSLVNGSHYPGLFIDDVNMQFQVSDGWGNQAAPIDSNTGQPMTYDAWRNYVASFLEQIRAALPHAKLRENAIWYAGPSGVQDADSAIQRQIATADYITLERGVASDPGLTGGTGFWSVYSFLNYVDRVHAAGKGVDFLESALDAAALQYGLASYFLISNGIDSIGDGATTPDNWWHGYDVDLGTPLGPRTYKNGIFERDFSGGKVLLGEPGLTPQTVNLGDAFTTLDGAPVTSVTLGGSQGYVLLAAGPPAADARAADPPADTVVNAASFAAGAASPGEIVSLFGSFSSNSPAVLWNGVPAPILYAGPNQINAIVPFGLDLGNPAQVQIQQGQANTTLSVPVAAASPAIFTLNETGRGPGAILNQDYSVNSAANPAARGSAIMIYGTGFGTLTPLPADGQIEPLAAVTTSTVTATIGGIPAEVLYAGAAPTLIAGVAQINVRVPAGVNPGGAVPISLQIGTFTTPTGVTVAIQ